MKIIKFIKEKATLVWTVVIFILGFIVSAVLLKRRKEEDILSEVENRIDGIEKKSKEKADEIKAKIDVVKTIEDKSKRMEELLRIWKELDED